MTETPKFVLKYNKESGLSSPAKPIMRDSETSPIKVTPSSKDEDESSEELNDPM